MGVTAKSGPGINYGVTTTSTGGLTEYNEERGPSLFDLGAGIMDPRVPYNYYPGAAVGTKVMGLWDNVGWGDVTQVSSSVGTPGAFLSCATGSSLTNVVTLNTSVSSALGVTLNKTIVAPESGATVTIPLTIDWAPPTVTFGSGGTVNMWNPNNALGRNIIIWGTAASSADDSSVALTVAGRDIYGFKMSETIVMSSLSITSRTRVNSSLGVGFGVGQKAFKYIQTMTFTNSSLINSTNVNISFGDVFGFPTRVDNGLYATSIVATSNSSNSTLFNNSSLGFTYASTLATQISSGPDVRGTWSSTTSQGAGFHIGLLGIVNPVNLGTIGSSQANVGLFGALQFSSV